MCRLILGVTGHEEKFLVPCENGPGVETLLADLSKDEATWPEGPISFDLWEEEPPLVVRGKALQYLTLERCDALADALALKVAEGQTPGQPAAPKPPPPPIGKATTVGKEGEVPGKTLGDVKKEIRRKKRPTTVKK